MSSPKISAIMAVYNAEPYLHRCLDCLKSQTLKDFDVIFVDDGSTDNSLSIAKDYAKADERFRVYHKENGGVSSARQYGINLLHVEGGEYSIHIDPDDWFEPHMFERLYQKAKETDADMVICDFFVNTTNRQKLYRQNPRSEDPRCVLGALFQRLHGSLWNKLIRSDCYNSYSIEFPVGLNYCEDFLVNVQLLQHINKVVYLPEAFYHYDQCINQNPATRNQSSKSINYTRKEAVRRCRNIVPNCLKDWKYFVFEAHKAFAIIDNGSMTDDELRDFFGSVPNAPLLHYHPFYLHTFFTICVVRGLISQYVVRFFYKRLREIRHTVIRMLNRKRA